MQTAQTSLELSMSRSLTIVFIQFQSVTDVVQGQFFFLIKKKFFKNHTALSFNVWYITSSIGPLPKLFKLFALLKKCMDIFNNAL